MNCPVCKEPMIVLELNQVEIDYCTSCESTWLDSGELEFLLEESTNKEKIISSLSIRIDVAEKKLKCPYCRKKMDKIKIEGKEAIIIDKCPRGEGHLFEKDELQKVLIAGNLSEDNPLVNQLKSIFAYKLK
ncbi:MAG: zf-TFIIB domain-containing protein [bacterium]